MKINLIFVLCCCMLMGCGKPIEQIETPIVKIQKTDETEYDILKDGFAYSRNYTPKASNLIHVEKRMIELSKEIFETERSILGQGTVLDESSLDRLLSAESSTNPEGLNMKKGERLKEGDQSFPAMRNIVSNITELDFYDKNDPSKRIGISLCLLMNTNVTDYEYNSYEISLDTAKNYGEEAAKKLVLSLRQKEELRDLPILVLIYSLSSQDESLPGVMVSQALSHDENVNFVGLDESWMIFPSSEANREDSESVLLFENLKEAINSYTKETVTMIARGHYVDKEMDSLKITVQTYSASYQFNLGLAQVLASECDELGSLNMKLKIEIQYYDDVIFTIWKDEQQKQCSILDLS